MQVYYYCVYQGYKEEKAEKKAEEANKYCFTKLLEYFAKLENI